MCGIIGAFNRENASQIVREGLAIIRERGRDGYGHYDGKHLAHAESVDDLPFTASPSIVGHALHAIVDVIPEPIKDGDGVLSANCEIYNWKELSKKYTLQAENDAVLLLKLINKAGVEKALEEIRGVYAFAYWKGDDIFIARDIIGIKPLWYSVEGGLVFCSEKKGMEKHCKRVAELNPRTILRYDLKTGRVLEIKRPFFPLEPAIDDEQEALQLLGKRLKEGVAMRIPGHKFGLLFSGGLDSAIIAKLLKDSGKEFTCYATAIGEKSQDAVHAKEAAAALGLPLRTVIIDKDAVEEYLERIVPLVEDNNVAKIGVALPLYVACESARKDGCRVIFSGSGADEVFGGYHRHKGSPEVNKDCYSDVLKLYEKNCYRDDVVTMNNNLELRVPFLDKGVVALGLRIGPSLKIKSGGGKPIEKYILRQLASEMGIPAGVSFRPKKAAQYGSGADAIIGTLAKKRKLSKSAYLAMFLRRPIMKLGALLSSGKDSLFAAYIMKRQNYEIACGITLQSGNPSSYMFHTPNIELVKLQAEAMGIPLVMRQTAGEKEKELDDLRKALEEAKLRHGIEGIVSGALFSNYQRSRIEKVGDELGLKLFSPLWHMDQEQELRQLLREGFEVIFVSVAAEGLDGSWLGRRITEKDVDRLAALRKKNGLNVAGEGGEYESLVVDCPMFGKKIKVMGLSMAGEGISVLLHIGKAGLKAK
ncbi:TPA: diphthine--ammonia ligase [Candidatus Woesearchaeota archaeon]|nr:diphthine--ammonia ligase [Candidatus Woesearchaeota archaeon]